jgi:hypothetical protein
VVCGGRRSTKLIFLLGLVYVAMLLMMPDIIRGDTQGDSTSQEKAINARPHSTAAKRVSDVRQLDVLPSHRAVLNYCSLMIANLRLPVPILRLSRAWPWTGVLGV